MAFEIDRYAADQWYRIKAELPADRSLLRAWAILRFEDDERRIALPVSLKGRLIELLPRPAARHELIIQIDDERGPLSTNGVSVGVIKRPVAWYVIWRRVLRGLFTLDKQNVRRLGLGFRKLLFEPFRSYRILGTLRYHFPSPDYTAWRKLYWFYPDAMTRRIERSLKPTQAFQSVVPVLVDNRQEGGQADASLNRQVGVGTRVIELATDDGKAAISGGHDWVLYTRPGQVLEHWALAWFLVEAAKHPDAVLVYSDHCSLASDGTPVSPRFKPDWSLELQRASHYVGDCILVRASALAVVENQLGYLPGAYELTLELSAMTGEGGICHIPAVLWHEYGQASDVDTGVLAAHLQRHAIDARIRRDERGQVRICYGVPANPPKISIVIPTRDLLHFLQPCVDSILARTTWPNYEILILDNQSGCEATLAYLQSVVSDDRVRVLPYDHRFNFSAINNFAVDHADGELVCLLNNDTEVISPDWLDEMACRLLQPGVGAVGARLYFADGRVQHAGDVLGPGGCASHLHGIIEQDDPGYMNRAVLPQELSAVTAACLLTYRSLYRELGGLDEVNLAVAFNDVDFCLRIREAGYRVVYTPYAELYHYESVSRGKDDDPAKKARAQREVTYMRERWAEVIERDPFYNPNLNYAKPDFTLGKYPRIDWPW